MKRILASVALCLAFGLAHASGNSCGTYSMPDPKHKDKEIEVHLVCEKAYVNASDKSSLQDGATTFMNYCVGCHSLKYIRYERMSQDLDIPLPLVEKYMMFTGSKVGDGINAKIDPKWQKEWFGAVPPDLSLETRLRSPDWVYNYLLSFYPDANRPFGVNNMVFKDVAMPHIMQELQKNSDPEDFKSKMANLVNFMTWASAPYRTSYYAYGVMVIIFLLILLVPVYLLNKDYWKNIH